MHVLIVEPQATGHHMALYTRLIVKAARQRGWRLHLLTTQVAVNHPAFKLVENAAYGELRVHMMPPVLESTRADTVSLVRKQLVCFRAISTGFTDIPSAERPDRVYMVNLDHCDKVIALLGSPFQEVRFSGMMMSPKYHRAMMGLGPPGRSDRVYRWLFHRMLRCRSLHKVTVIDECFYEYAQQANFEKYKKLQFVPDSGELHGNETKMDARLALGISSERFVILIYGSLTARKGIRELFRAVADERFKQVTVLLAGSPDETIESVLLEPATEALMNRKQLIVKRGFHDNLEEFRVFRAADVVWVGYVDGFYGSSGTFYQAGSIGLPVLAMQSGLIGWLVERYRTGLVCDPYDVENVSAVISRLLDSPELCNQLGENGRRLAQGHTGRRFSESVCEAI